MLNPEITQKLAADPNTSPEMLAKLLHNKDDYTAILASKNPNTPAKALWTTVDNKNFTYLLYGVCGNPSSPPELLTYVSTNEDFRVKEILAYNMNTPAEALNNVVKGKTPEYVLEIVARHPNTPVEVLFVLLAHPDRNVRTAAYNAPNTPEDLKPTAIFFGGITPVKATRRNGKNK